MADLIPTLSPTIPSLSALVQTALVREGKVEEALQRLRSGFFSGLDWTTSCSGNIFVKCSFLVLSQVGHPEGQEASLQGAPPDRLPGGGGQDGGQVPGDRVGDQGAEE